MPSFVITEEGVAVTNVALMSLRQAVAQQIEFETILEEVVKRQEDSFGTETATTEEKDKAGKKADENKKADEKKADKKDARNGSDLFTSSKPEDDGADDGRGASLNIKV